MLGFCKTPLSDWEKGLATMKFCLITAFALVALLSSCTFSLSHHSVAEYEAARSAREFISAESYQKRMTEIEAAHRGWESDPESYETRMNEIERAWALRLNSVYPDQPLAACPLRMVCGRSRGE